MAKIRITVNGKEEEITRDNVSVTKLLEIEGVKMPEMVSVELNGEILKKEEFPKTFIKKGDQIEFLYFMGGGGL